MQISNLEIINLFQTLSNLESKVLPIKFAYAVMRTKKNLKPIIDTFNELRNPPKAFNEYETKRVKLCANYAEKDEEGNPVIVDNNFSVSDVDLPKLQKEVEALKEEYAAVFSDMAQKEKDIYSLMQEDSEVEIFKVDVDHLPEKMTPVELEVIYPLIN